MLETMGVTPEEFLEYKGRPLVRKDNDIYYGDLSDNYHVFMMVMTDKPTSKGIDVPGMTMVQLLAKDATKPEKQIIAQSLADALETASAWLDRYNK